ncbi:MAG TPA: hypothetical protein PLC65_01110 [Bacteroidia bacterium]|nr:hypothetical protein [Bacteroidia bacterium]
MESKSRIAVWMNYEKAEFITHEPLNEHLQTIYSEHDIMPREDGQGADGTRWGSHNSSNEYHKNQKEAEQLKRYYNTLEKLLADYDEILLFGPTKAKEEFKNILAEVKPFATKSIYIESADNMTENQKIAFARDYFNRVK